MNQNERRIFLIQELLSERENENYGTMSIPREREDQKLLLRGLMNVRVPKKINPRFLQIQDEYLKTETEAKGIVELEDLQPVQPGIYLWQGDITTLRCDAIVNAANSGMTGCYVPNHRCIDNCIHTFAGVQLRLACEELMEKQGHEEPTGQAKITPAFNLPCKYILHTVGPIIYGKLRQKDCELLGSCYRSCLDLAAQNGLESVAFCCISTGEFHFPNEKAAEIAVETVQEFLQKKTRACLKNHSRNLHAPLCGRFCPNSVAVARYGALIRTKSPTNCDAHLAESLFQTRSSVKKVIFNVFKDMDREIYKHLLISDEIKQDI